MPKIGYAGGVALELFRLRTRNAELEPLARRAKSLQSTVDDLSRENLELRRLVYRKDAVKRQRARRSERGGSADRVSGPGADAELQ